MNPPKIGGLKKRRTSICFTAASLGYHDVTAKQWSSRNRLQ